MDKHARRGKLGRRQFAGAASAVAGAAVLASPALALAAGEEMDQVGPVPLPRGVVRTPGIRVDSRAREPVYLAAEDADYPAHVVAEVLFWTNIMMEHALFISLMLPGDRLRAPREQARSLQIAFANHHLQARDNVWRGDWLRPLLSQVRTSAADLVTLKRRLARDQASGLLQSLAFPSFLDHVAREGERFIRRIDELDAGQVGQRLDEVVSFWPTIMAEHLGFIAHLLDPTERELVTGAMKRADALHEVRARPLGRLQGSALADEVIDFKTAAEQGVETGAIKSIITPELADHVLREAVKFSDETRRSQ